MVLRSAFRLAVVCLAAAVAVSCATTDFSKSLPKSTPQVYGPGEVQYETRYVNGQGFNIGTAGDYQVWIAAYKGSPPHASIIMVNNSRSAENVGPKNIVVEGITVQGRGKEKREFLGTYSDGEYEKKVATENAWSAALYGLAAGLANTPYAQTSSFSGYDSYGGSYYGTVTTWPSAADYAAGSMRAQAQIAGFTSQLSASFNEMSASLFRRHTLQPGSYYGGTVYFQKKSVHRYAIYVPLGPKYFLFEYLMR